MNVIDFLFTSQLREDGSHGPITLPIYASWFLAEIEHLFGPRDRSFTLLGIDIDQTPGEAPHIWFPDSGIPSGDSRRRSRHIVIRLGQNALTDATRARWQLAHECLHLLDPWNESIEGCPANWLEEGLAAWYQNSRVPEAESHEGYYALAEDLVKPLMDELPNAIKRIRLEGRFRISEITPGVLRFYCPGLNEETLRMLCQPFQQTAGEVH